MTGTRTNRAASILVGIPTIGREELSPTFGDYRHGGKDGKDSPPVTPRRANHRARL